MQKRPLNLPKIKLCLEKANFELVKAQKFMRIPDWNSSVKASKLSIKYSAESLVWLVNKEIDNENLAKSIDDVVKELQETYKFGIYNWDKLERMRWIVSVWMNIREEAMHTYEPDAKFVNAHANEAYHISCRIIALVKSYVDTIGKSYPEDISLKW